MSESGAENSPGVHASVRGFVIRERAQRMELPRGAVITRAWPERGDWVSFVFTHSEHETGTEIRRLRCVRSDKLPRRDKCDVLSRFTRYDQGEWCLIEVLGAAADVRNMQFAQLKLGVQMIELPSVATLNVACPMRRRSGEYLLCYKRGSLKGSKSEFYAIVLATQRSVDYGSLCAQAGALRSRGVVRFVDTPQEPGYSLWVDSRLFGN